MLLHYGACRFRICWGVVVASRNSSRLQGRYRLERNSHLAASRSDPDVCARSLLIGRAFSSEPRAYPPRQSRRADHISSSVSYAAAEAARSLLEEFICGCLHNLISDRSVFCETSNTSTSLRNDGQKAQEMVAIPELLDSAVKLLSQICACYHYMGSKDTCSTEGIEDRGYLIM